MLNGHGETLITFQGLIRYLREERLLDRPGFATVQRWALNGIRGVRLETWRCGGFRGTTIPAFHRFVKAVNALPLRRDDYTLKRRKPRKLRRWVQWLLIQISDGAVPVADLERRIKLEGGRRVSLYNAKRILGVTETCLFTENGRFVRLWELKRPEPK